MNVMQAASKTFIRSFGVKSNLARKAVLQSSTVLHKACTTTNCLRMFTNKSLSEEEAMAKIKCFVKAGQGMKETAVVYDEEGKNYNDALQVLGYSAARKCGELVKNLLGDKTDVKILDVGAGTGLSGQELYRQGFTKIDGVDGSDGMLAEAKKLNIYGQLVCHFVGDDPMPFSDKSYDLVTAVGAMTENHIPTSGLSDMIRVVKSGGYIVNVFRKPALTTPYYQNDLKGSIKELEDKGVWTLVEEGSFPNMLKGLEGYFLIHKVL